jgi:hypothetical protein
MAFLLKRPRLGLGRHPTKAVLLNQAGDQARQTCTRARWRESDLQSYCWSVTGRCTGKLSKHCLSLSFFFFFGVLSDWADRRQVPSGEKIAAPQGTTQHHSAPALPRLRSGRPAPRAIVHALNCKFISSAWERRGHRRE